MTPGPHRPRTVAGDIDVYHGAVKYRGVRIALWIFYLAMVVSLLTVVTRPIVVRSTPPIAPDNACALLPADLLALVVPSAAAPVLTVNNGRPYTNTSRCLIRTETSGPERAASGYLILEVDRNGSQGGDSAESHAQTSFALGKKFAQEGSIIQRRVNDLAGLGDSAYLAVVIHPDGSREDAGADVAVLSGDMIVTVQYSASPSDDRLVAAAAVRLARELVKAVR